MRRDVKQVIAERPKSNRTWASKTPRKKRPVLDVSGEQMDENADAIRREQQKYRRTRFNVLERFLLNRVGRPWDRVYAEACDVADARSLQGAEAREYLKRTVAIDCWREGRTLMSYDCHGCPQRVQGLYVDPKSGLLSRNDISK